MAVNVVERACKDFQKLSVSVQGLKQFNISGKLTTVELEPDSFLRAMATSRDDILQSKAGISETYCSETLRSR